MANNFPNLLPSLNLDLVNGIYVDPRITFTRAGTRTYYGRDVVKAEENLLIHSADLTQTAYFKSGVTASSATQITATATTAFHIVHYNTSVGGLLPGSGTVTQTLRISAGTYNFIQIFIANGTTEIANINLTNGTIGTNTLGVTATDLGSGVYDIKCTYTTTGTNRVLGVALVTSTTAARLESWTALGTETVNILFQQYEQRSSATAYTATTTQPITRYQRQLKTAAANEWPREFDPVTGECLGRSVWESRTNLLLYSEEFDNAYWTKSNVTISTNQIIAPDGTLTADKLVEDATSNQHRVLRAIDGSTKNVSIYAKAAERSYIGLFAAVGTRTYFNLSAGTIGTVSSGSTATIESVGNGWYRCSLYNAHPTNGGLFQLSTDGTTETYTGDGYSGIYIWGAQLEAGAFATPYIPTVAAQVTRLADSAVMTGTNFSSWFNPSEGTFVVNSTGLDTSFTVAVQVDDGTTSNRIGMIIPRASSASPAFIFTSGAAQTAFSNVTFVGDDKEALSYAANNVLLSVNGAAVQTDTTVVLPVVDRLRIRNNSAAPSSGYIKRITYYPQALTAANLQAVTR